MRDYYTISELLDPKHQSKRIAEEKAEADAYDLKTGTNQRSRDIDQITTLTERRAMFTRALVEALTPADKAAYCEQIERLSLLIDSELTRLGLAE